MYAEWLSIKSIFMRRNFFTGLFVAIVTFFTLQLTIGQRYWGAYGWGYGYGSWHHRYYAPPPGYYRYDMPPDRWQGYGPWWREELPAGRTPGDSGSSNHKN
jgi:hypothetical protein